MLKSILLGIDGSDYCEVAVKTSVDIAKALGCRLSGLGIVDIDSIFDSSPGVAGSMHFKKSGDKAQYRRALERVNKCLAGFENKCKTAGIEYDARYHEGSPPQEFIKEAVGYDVIMFGQKTYFQTEKREGPCDTLVQVLKNTPRPVLVAPRNMKPYSVDRPAVVAFDGSLPSARAMQLFTLLSYDDTSSNIHVVTVADNEEEGHGRQSKALDFFERWYGQAPTSVVLTGKRSQSILEYSKDINARIIVMGAYGVSGLKSIFFGSVTRSILEKSESLLFLYH